MIVDIEFDDVELADAVPEAVVTDVRRPVAGQQRHRWVDVPGRAGSWVFPEEPGDGVLEVDVALLVDDLGDLRDAVRRLAGWASPESIEAPLVVSDEPDRRWVATLSQAPSLAEVELSAGVTLEFRCAPWAEALTVSTETLAQVGLGGSVSFTAPNGVPSPAVVEVTPTGGGVSSFTLTMNGRALVFAAAVPAGSPRTISTVSYTVTDTANGDVDLDGSFDSDDLAMQSVSGDFPFVVPGLNQIAVSGAGTATGFGVKVWWRRRFR